MKSRSLTMKEQSIDLNCVTKQFGMFFAVYLCNSNKLAYWMSSCPAVPCKFLEWGTISA